MGITFVWFAGAVVSTCVLVCVCSRLEDHEGLRREYEILTLGIDVWHVLEYEHSKLEATSHGQFHTGDTYVIRWHYMVTQTGVYFSRSAPQSRAG